MTTLQTAPAASAKFDNNGQYSRTGILRYEKIFGDHYISTGGHATTEDLCSRLGSALRPGVRVLDVGSGIGGAAFHLAKAYGARVTGIDLAEEMVAIAQERVVQLGLTDSVAFILGDVLETDFPEPFDVIWSRDAFMHIPDKPRLFSRLYSLMAPGGRLVITDYARGKTPGSPEFEHYIEKTGYSVIEPQQYGELLEAAGFADVVVDDATGKFVEILQVRGGSPGRRSRRVPGVVLGVRPGLPGRPLEHEDRLLPGRRHEVGHLRGRQEGLIGPEHRGGRAPSVSPRPEPRRQRADARRSPGWHPTTACPSGFVPGGGSAGDRFMPPTPDQTDDSRDLAALGYKPVLNRTLGSFSVVRGGVLVHLDPDRRVPDVLRGLSARAGRPSSGRGRRCSWAN